MGISVIALFTIVGVAALLLFAWTRSNSQAPSIQTHTGRLWVPAVSACVAVLVVPSLCGYLVLPPGTQQHVTSEGSWHEHDGESGPPAVVTVALNRQEQQLRRRQDEIASELADYERRLAEVMRQRKLDETRRRVTGRAFDFDAQMRECLRDNRINNLEKEIFQLKSEQASLTRTLDDTVTGRKIDQARTTPKAPPGHDSSSHSSYSQSSSPFFVRNRTDKAPDWVTAKSETADASAISEGGWARQIDRKRFPVQQQREAIAISSGWYATEEEALKELTERSQRIVNGFFQQRWGDSLPAPNSSDRLPQEMVADCQIEKTIKDFGNDIREPMCRAHAWLNVDVSENSQIYQMRAAKLQNKKLWQLTILAAGATIGLAAFGQCVRWNLRTEGRYRGRLFALATAVAGCLIWGVLFAV